MTTIITMFSGIGGVDCGAIMANITPIGGVEYDPQIAEIAAANGCHITVGDVLELLPPAGKVDILHASPPCPSFSMANNKRGETAHDMALSGRVADYAEVLQPDIITIENVPLYRLSQSWLLLQARLMGMGYFCTAKIINMANYGVPQTRERMIVVFSRGLCPGWGMAQESWANWYDAVNDLLPECKLGKIPAWVANNGRLGELPEGDFMIKSNDAGNTKIYRQPKEPGFTVATEGQGINVKINTDIYRLNNRALARLQSFPDSWYIPETTAARRGVGNAVPPLFYAKLLKELGF